MVDHIPQGDDVEGALRQVSLLKSTTADPGEAECLASIPNGCWRDLTAIRLPSRIRCQRLQKEAEPTSHVEESSRPPNDKSFEEILMHSAAGVAPVEVITLGNRIPPILIIMRVGCEGREDVAALTALENVDARFLENGAVSQISTQ